MVNKINKLKNHTNTAAAAAGVAHKESTHWKVERVVSVGMLGLISTAMVAGPIAPVCVHMCVRRRDRVGGATL